MSSLYFAPRYFMSTSNLSETTWVLRSACRLRASSPQQDTWSRPQCVQSPCHRRLPSGNETASACRSLRSVRPSELQNKHTSTISSSHTERGMWCSQLWLCNTARKWLIYFWTKHCFPSRKNKYTTNRLSRWHTHAHYGHMCVTIPDFLFHGSDLVPVV